MSTETPTDILIVDDEDDIRMLIEGLLEDEGYKTREAANSDQALAAIAEKRPDLVIQDIWLEDSALDGLQILEELRDMDPDLPVIMISGHGTIEMAVSALHNGAYDFIEKPFKSDRLLMLVKRALESVALRRENKRLRQRQSGMADLKLNGQSPKIRQIQQTIERVGPTESRVLITGAPGTGKEVAARLIHNQSPRAENPFVILNCALMTPDRMDEELFGIEENGVVRKNGLLEQADEGTLFLDEVSDMPLETQGKILHVLIDQSFTRIGGNSRIDVDARIIAATNQNLQNRIADGKFREDLYYRLNVVPLPMPRLSERRDDIPELIDYFVTRIAHENGVRPLRFSEEAIIFLQGYSWQGNIRQLRNVIEWSLIVNAGDDESGEMSVEMLPPEIRGAKDADNGPAAQAYAELMTKSLRDARHLFEREYLKAQIERFNGNISRTAKFVGMERSALHRKIKMLGLAEENEVELNG
ncbi:MAG: sigma-54-dependent transcriptional regulator [Pseudomonadota bacterium]